MGRIGFKASFLHNLDMLYWFRDLVGGWMDSMSTGELKCTPDVDIFSLIAFSVFACRALLY